MAKLRTSGAHELVRWVNAKTGGGFVLRSDGVLLKRASDGWRKSGRLRASADPEEEAGRIRSKEAFSPHAKDHIIVDATPPMLSTLMRWERQGRSEAPDGCTVEPDGTCPHGYKSWLLLRGLI